MPRDLSTLSKALTAMTGDMPRRVDHVEFPDGRIVDCFEWHDDETAVFEKKPGASVKKIAKEDFSL